MATWEAFVIGCVSASLCYSTMKLVEMTSFVDDPCASFAVHGVGGIWGMIAVGIFAQDDERSPIKIHNGLREGK